MRRIQLLTLTTTLSAAAWSTSQAAGSFQKPGPHAVKAGMPSIPMPSLPDVTARDLVGGCGKGASTTRKHTVAVAPRTSGNSQEAVE